MVKKFRKRPVVIEAVQFTYENMDEVHEWAWKQSAGVAKNVDTDGSPLLLIHTLEGVMQCEIGDYVIKGVNGEIYPCKPDIFKKTYDSVTNGVD